MNRSWTGGQYSIYRALLGAFLVVHFACCCLMAPRYSARAARWRVQALSPYFGVLPNPFA